MSEASGKTRRIMVDLFEVTIEAFQSAAQAFDSGDLITAMAHSKLLHAAMEDANDALSEAITVIVAEEAGFDTRNQEPTGNLFGQAEEIYKRIHDEFEANCEVRAETLKKDLDL